MEATSKRTWAKAGIAAANRRIWWNAVMHLLTPTASRARKRNKPGKDRKSSHASNSAEVISGFSWHTTGSGCEPFRQASRKLSRVIPRSQNPSARRRCHSLHSKRRAQPGLCLRNNYQQQIPWTNPALPLGKPLPPLNSTSLATKTEQRRSHPQWRHRHRKRIGHSRPNPCLEPPTLDRTRRPSALRSPV